jgi:hypothetical protein
MPLTFCHPAIILSLQKLKPKWFSMTGLIIGSMSPDLEYFTRMKIEATHSHLFWGVLYFDLPIALAYCFIFHFFIRKNLINHLPYFFKTRFHSYINFDWMDYFKKHWLIVILSIVIGGYSHLFWDAFTHEWGYFVKLIPMLQEVLFNQPIEVKGYKFLQHFSTLIGGLFIIFWIYKIPKHTITKTNFDYNFWIIICVLTIVISVIRFVFFPVEFVLGNIIVVIGMSGFLSLVLDGIFVIFNKKAR